jgi:hypothetical protein
MNKVKITIYFVTVLHLSTIAQVPSPVPNWPYSSVTRGAQYATIRFALDTGEQLHVFHNTLLGEFDKFLLDRSFFPGWPFSLDTLLFPRTPILADIDHDVNYEIVTTANRVYNNQYYYGLIYIFEEDGSIMSGWPVRVQWPTLNVADLDSDNEYEIISYSNNDDSIYCFDHNGNLKPGWPIPFHLPGVEFGYKPRNGAIGDLNLDGMNEFILSGVWDIFAFQYDGTMLPGFHINLQDTTYLFYNAWQPPALADLDGDGYLEIITSGDNWSLSHPQDFTSFVAVYDHQGNVENGWPVEIHNQSVLNAVTPSDIDDDAILEIGIKTNQLTFVHFEGDTLPGWPSQNIPSNDDLIVVDLNGDRYCEIFCDNNVAYPDTEGYYGWLYGLDHLGQFLPDYPIRTRGSYLGLPPSFALGRASHRLYMGLADIAPYSSQEYTVNLELFIFPDSTGPTTEWPMKAHDNLMTRNYNFVDRVTSTDDEGKEILPRNYILRQNYPNPFNFSTIIEFTLPKEEHVILTVYDILGRKIEDLVNGEVSAGPHAQRVTFPNLSSGVYYYLLQTPTTQISRKMVLLK